MSNDADKARTILIELLDRLNKPFDGDLEDDTPLYRDGLGLDSLEAAELSAVLEDELGTDPFSAGDELPGTVGDILAFYDAASAA